MLAAKTSSQTSLLAGSIACGSPHSLGASEVLNEFHRLVELWPEGLLEDILSESWGFWLSRAHAVRLIFVYLRAWQNAVERLTERLNKGPSSAIFLRTSRVSLCPVSACETTTGASIPAYVVRLLVDLIQPSVDDVRDRRCIFNHFSDGPEDLCDLFVFRDDSVHILQHLRYSEWSSVNRERRADQENLHSEALIPAWDFVSSSY